MLKAYDEYKPGMGDEVVDWAKNQTRHRQALEKQSTDGSEHRLNLAQSNSFKIALGGVAVAALVSAWNTPVAIAIALVTVGGPAGATIVARFFDRGGKDD